MASLNFQVFLALLGLFQLTLVKSQEQCTNPIGQTGVCMDIKQCNPLLGLLRVHGNAIGDFLRASVCSRDGSTIIICCPIGEDSSNNERTSTTPAPTAPPTRNSGKYWPIYAPTCGVGDNTIFRIVKGVPARLGAWPWMAALGYRSTKEPNKPKWLCGGTLVSTRHVLTAAHCVHGRNDLYIVRLGDLDLNDNIPDGASPIDVLIEKVTKHPTYSPRQYTNDIAVLRLREEVTFTELMKPICLPWIDELRTMDLVKTTPFIAGWGSIFFRGPGSTHLQQAQVPVVDTEKCKVAFTRFKNAVVDKRVLCAGSTRGGQDACQGDSGGPLMFASNGTGIYSFYQIGVVSYGYRCAEPGIPGVYTRVTEFLDFLRSTLN